MLKILLLPCLFVLASCHLYFEDEGPDETPHPSETDPGYQLDRPYQDQCRPSGDICGQGASCCAPSFCSDDVVFSYGDPLCTDPMVDGSFCLEDGQCASGSCSDNLCFSGCAGEGSSCEYDACCEGSFCSLELNVYSEGVCTAPMPEGSFCQVATQCASNLCLSGRCTDASACAGEGHSCGFLACCPGSFCSVELFGYGSIQCQAPLPRQSFCHANHHCASGNCIDGQCQ